MTMTIDRLRIAGTANDRRIKLTDTQRCEIRERYKAGNVSTYTLANEYGVSRRTIDFVLHPDRYERCREQFKERRKDGRYKPSREEWADTMREHRKYKKSIIKNLSDTREESTWQQNNFGSK